MTTAGMRAGWYVDPDQPEQLRHWNGERWSDTLGYSPKGRSTVFRRTLLWGFVIGVMTGTITGTAAVPVIGTVIGAIIGFAIGTPLSLLVAAFIHAAAEPPIIAATYRRRVDLVLAAVAVAVAALGWWFCSIGVIYLAIVVCVVDAVALLIVRRWLRRMVRPLETVPG